MRWWLSRIVAAVTGLAVSVLLIMAVQALSIRLYPPPTGVDFADPEALARLMDQLPIGSLLMVELSYIAGSLGGGIAVSLVMRNREYRLAAIVGALLTAFGFLNLAAIPHPIWFAIVTTITYIPCSLLGALAWGFGTSTRPPVRRRAGAGC